MIHGFYGDVFLCATWCHKYQSYGQTYMWAESPEAPPQTPATPAPSASS